MCRKFGEEEDIVPTLVSPRTSGRFGVEIRTPGIGKYDLIYNGNLLCVDSIVTISLYHFKIKIIITRLV